MIPERIIKGKSEGMTALTQLFIAPSIAADVSSERQSVSRTAIALVMQNSDSESDSRPALLFFCSLGFISVILCSPSA